MKKHFFGITAFIVISLAFISCPNDPGNDDPVIPINPDQKTLVVFDNTYGICTALVYDDYRRRDMDRIAEIPAGECSDEIECTPDVSTPFYFAYRISLKNVSGFSVDFVPAIGKDQRAVRLDAGTRTVIPIPVLDDTVSSQEQVLSLKSYLSVLNSSTYSFQLHRGVSMIRPDNSPNSGVVNSGERAPYTTNPGRSSDYRLLVGADYIPFPNSPDRFEAGNFYSYIFNADVSLDVQIPINLDNVDIKTYTVHFDSNGGSGTIPAAQNVRAASGITLPVGSGLSNGDEIFGGWCADASGTGIVYSEGTSYTVTGDITLYAKWYPAGTTLYTVTFDSASGNETASQSMVSGAVAIRPADPYRANYTFDGWYRDSGAQTSYNFAAPVTEDFTLYAKWIANKYTVTFHANGADGAAPAVTVDYGVSITLPTADGLSKPYGTFDGWNTEDDGNGTAYASGEQYTVTADVTLFAVWESPVHTVTFDSAGGSETASQSMVSGAVAIRPPDPYRTGYTFDGWYSDVGAQTLYDFAAPVTESFTLYAAWSANRHMVTFHANGADGAAPAAVTVDYGVSITLPGADGLSKPYRTFDGWSTENDGTGTTYTSGAQYTVTADVTLFAVWIGGINDGLVEMVYVPGGSFIMGKNLGGGSDITPIHTVTLSAFYIGTYEVTQAQYEAVMEITIEEQQALAGTNTTDYGKGNDHPMYYVSWYDALVFCNRLSMAEGLNPAYRINNSTDPAVWGNIPASNNSAWNAVEMISGSNGYRLPTEAQWEYAAKGGNDSPGNYTYAGSNNPDGAAWYNGNSGSTSHTVGTKAPNWLGIYDMSGNVWEWCHDWYGNYSSAEQTNPAGASSGSDRVIRGGSSYHSAQYSSSVFRYNNNQHLRNYSQGFRLVRPAVCNVSFDLNGGIGTAPAAQIASPTTTLPGGDGFSRIGYAFSGWNTDASGTGINYPAGSSYHMVTTNVTLYAKWIELYTVTFDLNYVGSPTLATQEIIIGSKASRPSNPVRTDFVFDGWYTEEETINLYDFDTSVNRAITLYAKWIHIVTFDMNYTGLSGPQAQEVSNGAKAIRPSPDPVRSTGSVFDGWYLETAFINLYDFDTPVTANITLYAKWTYIVLVTINVSNDTELLSAFSQIQSSTDEFFEIVVTDSFSVDPVVLQGADFRGKTVTLRSNGGIREISLNTTGSLLTLSGSLVNFELILKDITLRGRTDNNAPLVQIEGGKCIMESGAAITGNTNSGSVDSRYIQDDDVYSIKAIARGGGVNINGGTLIMSGGSITGNTVSATASVLWAGMRISLAAFANGGGIYISKGTLTIAGGSISNNTVTASASASGSSVSARAFAYGGGVCGGISAYDVDSQLGTRNINISEGIVSGNTVSASASDGTSRPIIQAYGNDIYY